MCLSNSALLASRSMTSLRVSPFGWVEVSYRLSLKNSVSPGHALRRKPGPACEGRQVPRDKCWNMLAPAHQIKNQIVMRRECGGLPRRQVSQEFHESLVLQFTSQAQEHLVFVGFGVVGQRLLSTTDSTSIRLAPCPDRSTRPRRPK